jgi:hypothetical protein
MTTAAPDYVCCSSAAELLRASQQPDPQRLEKALAALRLEETDPQELAIALARAALQPAPAGEAMVERLLDFGAKADLESELSGKSAIFRATKAQDEGAVRRLAQAVDCRALIHEGLTPLMTAARDGSSAAVRALLPFSDPDQKAAEETSWMSRTALFIAIGEKRKDDMLKTLINVSDPFAEDSEGNALTTVAMHSQQIEIAEPLARRMVELDRARALRVAESAARWLIERIAKENAGGAEMWLMKAERHFEFLDRWVGAGLFDDAMIDRLVETAATRKARMERASAAQERRSIVSVIGAEAPRSDSGLDSPAPAKRAPRV